MKLLLELFGAFAKIGLFTFGGGYAMIALIEDICVERKKWITYEEMLDIFANYFSKSRLMFGVYQENSLFSKYCQIPCSFGQKALHFRLQI